MIDKTLLLRDARLVLPETVVEDGAIEIAGGRITRVYESGSVPPDTDAEVIDLGGALLFPGFVDIHIHGAVGVDLMSAGADDLRRVARFLASEGTTAWLPTTVPADAAGYRSAADAVDAVMADQDAHTAAARVLGIHYEGPFVNPERHGALHAEHFQIYPGEGAARNLLPRLRDSEACYVTTLAPEIEGGIELTRDLAREGWIVSAGHTNADPLILDEARSAGVRHMTHFMNAMSGLHHRAPGAVGWGLMRDDVTCEIIADFVHVDPLALQVILRCKTPERVILVSDAVAPAGLGDGDHQLWGETISVGGGRTRNARGDLAGSVITIRDAVRNLLSIGVAAHDVGRMAATNPARLLGLEDECGSIREGLRADLVALDTEGRVTLALVGGRRVDAGG